MGWLGWLCMAPVIAALVLAFGLARLGLGVFVARAIMGRVCTDAKATALPKSPNVPFFAGLPPVLNIAHRGASRLAPEHSLEAYELALQQGAHVLELDLRLTRDRVLVVAHDPTLRRTHGLDAAFSDLDLAELERIAAGRVPPPHPPVFSRFPETRFNLELKDETLEAARALAALVRERSLEDRVLVASSHEPVLSELRMATGGAVATSASAREALDYLVCYWMERTCPATYSALQIPAVGWLGLTSARFVGRAHAHGLAVHFWTVDDPERMRALLAVGADGIMTNRPDVLAPLLVAQR
jgi:glycerophosphoryl diester phosphodiesterase